MRYSKNFQKLLDAIRDAKDRLVAVVVHLNDTYLIEERPDRRLPGFARLIATVGDLREYVERTAGPDRFLVVHSGDFLGPSLLAKSDKGQGMVELLEKVGLDYCVLGNHEFDHGAEILADRVNRKKFKVLLANAKDPTGLVKVSAGAWWPGDKPIVAITGIVSESVSNSFRSPGVDYDDEQPWLFEPPNEAMLRFLETSREALFRLILSHASQPEDRRLRRQIPALPRTYILGGHDHDIEWIEDDQSVFVMKNLANCETVRACLLLAGGESVVSELFIRHERLQLTRQAAAYGGDIGTPRYPEDLEAVLLMTSDIDRAAIHAGLAERERAGGPFDDLDDALSQVHYKPDLLSTKLHFDDHQQAAQSDVDLVERAIATTKDPDDARVVRDFTSQTKGQLEARDSHIRRRPTNFGVFVAECIRLHANAQVAIVNSGAFRCDSVLSPKLHIRDLREAFLYDAQGAIIVLELDSAVIDALLAHGRSKGGSGAYPQISDARSGGSGKVVVAIASYLLTKEDSIDGYAEVLAQSLGEPSTAKAREFAVTAAEKNGNFCVIEAVRTQASNAAFIDLPDVGGASTQGADLIELLKGYADTFFAEVQAAKAPLRRSFPTEPERNRAFQEWLGSDQAIPSSPSIRVARDKVRAFLRALPAVAAYHGRAGANWVGAWSAAEAELVAMQASVAGHDYVFRDRADYGWLFDLAACGLPGWRSMPG